MITNQVNHIVMVALYDGHIPPYIFHHRWPSYNGNHKHRWERVVWTKFKFFWRKSFFLSLGWVRLWVMLGWKTGDCNAQDWKTIEDTLPITICKKSQVNNKIHDTLATHHNNQFVYNFGNTHYTLRLRWGLNHQHHDPHHIIITIIIAIINFMLSLLILLILIILLLLILIIIMMVIRFETETRATRPRLESFAVPTFLRSSPALADHFGSGWSSPSSWWWPWTAAHTHL